MRIASKPYRKIIKIILLNDIFMAVNKFDEKVLRG